MVFNLEKHCIWSVAISCIVRQLSFSCHNALPQESVQKIEILWRIVISVSRENYVVNSWPLLWRYEAKCVVWHLLRWEPQWKLFLGCSQHFLQICLGFLYSDVGKTPTKSEQCITKLRESALQCPQAACLPYPQGTPAGSVNTAS